MHNTPNMVCYNTQNLIISKSQILKQKNPRNFFSTHGGGGLKISEKNLFYALRPLKDNFFS